MKPIIVTDVDGVLLKWQHYAHNFCEFKGMNTNIARLLESRELFLNPFTNPDGSECVKSIVEYNHQPFMEHLPAYADARSFTEWLGHDFNFIAVTAMSENPEALERRRKNLDARFGSGKFIDVFGVGIRDSKAKVFHKLNQKYGDRLVGYVDDCAHHLIDARAFMPSAKLFHLVRDVRDASVIPCKVISSLTQLSKEDFINA